MRALIDTLPTLRDEADTNDAGPVDGGFDPSAIARALKIAKLAPADLAASIATADPTLPRLQPQRDPVAASTAALRETLERVRHQSQATGVSHDALGPATISGEAVASKLEAIAPANDARRSEPAPTPVRASVQPAASAIPDLAAPSETEAERTARAVEAALAEARAEAEMAVAAAREEERVAAEDRLAEARRAWVAQEAERLAQAHGAAFAELSDRLQTAIGRVLAPIVDAKVKEAAVTRFADLIVKHTRDYSAPYLRVEGPEDLLEALRDALPDPAGITFARAQRIDMEITIEETRLTTRLSDWAVNSTSKDIR